MRELALHLLDIAENSVAANAKVIQIGVDEDLKWDRLKLCVEDDGRGMDEDLVKRVIDPFVTSRTTRKVGLGIPLLKAAAEACNGYLRITSAPGRGTRLEAEFQRSHIDRMPLGDVAGTLLALVVGWPKIHWVFRYRVNAAGNGSGNGSSNGSNHWIEYVFDDEPIKQELGDVPMTEPAILAFIRESLQEGISNARREAVASSPSGARTTFA
jgi:hypothetical protein